MSKSKIFLSYSWKNKITADEIDNVFKSVGITLIRDVRDIKEYESITDFMKKIRISDYVLMIISDDYFKSRNCMYEVLEIANVENYKSKILPILLNDARKIFSFEGKVEYIKYWENKFNDYNYTIRECEEINKITLLEEVKFIENIKRNIGEFMKLLSNMQLSKYTDLQELNYKPILSFIGYKNNEVLSELIRISKIEDNEDKEIEMEIFRKKFSDTKEYLFYKAYNANENKKYKSSNYYYNELLKLNPNYPDAHNNLAILLINYFEDYDNAKFHYKKALEIDPNNSSVHRNLGLLLEKHYQDYDKAKLHYKRALMIDPNYSTVHYDLALLLVCYYKDYDSAKYHFQKALEIDPNYSNAHNNLALLLESYYKSYEEAKSHYKKVLEIDPNCSDAHNNLAILLINQYEDYDNAKYHFQKALEIDPNNSNIYNNLAALLVKQYQDYDNARFHYQKALEIDPNNSNTHNNLAVLLEEQYQDYDNARFHYHKALEIDSSFIDTYDRRIIKVIR